MQLQSTQPATMSGWRQMAVRAVGALAGISTLYGLGIIGYLLARLLVGERWSLVELGDSLMPSLLLPAVGLAIVFLPLRRWRVTLALLPGVIAFLLLYGSQFIPRAASTNGREISVLTYNLRSQLDNAGGIAAVIRSAHADVVSLQELSGRVADQLAVMLADVYPHQALHGTDAFAKGQGVFSRYPVVDDVYWDMILGSQRVRLELDDNTLIALFNLHPVPPQAFYGFNSSARSREIQELLGYAAAETIPVILAGDFNTTDQTDDYARVAARYHDTFREVGWGLGATFPHFRRSGLPFASIFAAFVPPVIRIDYVFHSDHFAPLEARVLPDSGGSDHYPVFARLALR